MPAGYSTPSCSGVLSTRTCCSSQGGRLTLDLQLAVPAKLQFSGCFPSKTRPQTGSECVVPSSAELVGPLHIGFYALQVLCANNLKTTTCTTMLQTHSVLL